MILYGLYLTLIWSAEAHEIDSNLGQTDQFIQKYIKKYLHKKNV